MGRYVEKKDFWKIGKALVFFTNFIGNHRGEVLDKDAFAVVADLVTADELRDLVIRRFPPETILRMNNLSPQRNRLDFNNEPREILREMWCADFARRHLLTMLAEIVAEHQALHPLDKCADEPFARRCAELKTTLALSDFELDALLVLVFLGSDLLCIPDVRNRRCDEYDKASFVAKCLDCDVSEALEALNEKGKLRRFGCIDCDLDFNGALMGFLNGARTEPIRSCYFQICRDEVLPWEFYGSLGEKHGAILKRIIDRADGKTPVNILLYGAPGTGKTSFAKSLAAELGRKCYAVAQSTRVLRGGEATGSPAFRFGALQICDHQADPAKSMIVVDEADEMLRGNDGGGIFAIFGARPAPTGDKGLLNSVLDSVTTPTVWIANTAAEELDESSRRRFDYSIRFDPLDAEQRFAIWRNNVGKLKLGKLIGGELMRKFADRYPVSAGGITLILRNVAQLAPAPAEVETLVESLMKPHCELLGVPGAVDEETRPAADYSLDGLNIRGRLPLGRVVDAVRRFRELGEAGADRPRMNLLLSGAPGTGKTEFVKYLGAQLGTRVVVRMGSDLLSMFVGGTEKRIRQAFEQAEAEKAILFLDEIDGLVQSRERAHRNWEISQVNELLHQMEVFKGVMVGATNFSAHLDPAILRRFTFKLEFDYLDAPGKKLFFERMFKSRLSDAEAEKLAAIPCLAPGDFRTVRQGFFYLGGDVTNAELLDALERESAVKRNNASAERAAIGF